MGVLIESILALVIVAGVVWFFWMTWEWLRNRNKKTPPTPTA